MACKVAMASFGQKGRFIQLRFIAMMDNVRQMYDVNETCADCGAAITQLPFQPSGDKPVYCSNCLRNRRAQRGGSAGGFGGGAGARRPRQMFDVDLTCAQCGTHISQLPFQPSGDRPVYCADCNRNRRAAM